MSGDVINDRIRQLTSESEDEQQAALKALKAMGTQAIDPLTALLSDPEQPAQTRQMAVWVLGEIGLVSGANALVQALHDPDPQVRILAIIALGNIGAEAVVAPLATMLTDPDETVRREASGTLVQLGQMSEKAAIPLLTHPEAYVREAAITVVRWVSGANAVEPLMVCLTDESATVRWQAARALGRLRDQKSVPHLRQLLRDPDDKIRQTAEISLRKLGARLDAAQQ